MEKFYKLKEKKKKEKDAEESDEQVEKKGKKYYDEDGQFKWDAQSSSDEEDKSADEDDQENDADDSDLDRIVTIKPSKVEESGEDEDKLWSSEEENNTNKGVKQHKIVKDEEVQIGKRLALTNMDWDNLNSTDILAIFTSLCSTSASGRSSSMVIEKVEIYPSLFGLEQMKKDTLYGPPKELFENEEDLFKKKKKKKARKAADGLVDIDEEDNEEEAFDMNQLRKYEINKMKYFYAIIYCNTKKTAERLYNEYNDYEFEQSNLRLNLSFVADDLIFPQEVKESATEVPPDYEFKVQGQDLNKARNHTKIKLTWDETDPKRLRKFQKIMDADPDEVDEEAYKEFLASGTDSEAEQAEERLEKDKIEEYRQKLLGSLSDSKDIFRQRDLKADQSDDDNELDIKFNTGFGEDIGKKMIKKMKEEDDEEEETAWEKYQRKRKEKRKEKKQ